MEVADGRWFREAWLKKSTVRVDLDERCAVRHLEGVVKYVATTGAFCLIRAKGAGDWHVPLDAVKARAVIR